MKAVLIRDDERETDVLREIFDNIDRDGDGGIDFKEFRLFLLKVQHQVHCQEPQPQP